MPPSDQEPRYQLVDSNGNVVGSLFGDGSGNVVIADETDTQTTFDANGITTPALEAEKTTRTGISEDAENVLTDYDNGTGSKGQETITLTDGVSTTATKIFSPINGEIGGLVYVYGQKDSSTNVDFSDLVLSHPFVPPVVVGSNSRGSADSRNYQVDGGDLDLTMSANTYNISAFAISHANLDP